MVALKIINIIFKLFYIKERLNIKIVIYKKKEKIIMNIEKNIYKNQRIISKC